jgi:hypothetical protein
LRSDATIALLLLSLFCVVSAGETFQGHDGLVGREEGEKLYEHARQVYEAVHHRTFEGEEIMNAGRVPEEAKDQLRELEARYAEIQKNDLTNQHVEDAKRLLSKLKKGERLILKVTIDSYTHLHWDVIEVSLDEKGEVVIVNQFGLNPEAASLNPQRESIAAWIKRENKEAKTWKKKYLIQDWRVVPAKSSETDERELVKVRQKEAKIFTKNNYVPVFHDCNSAANFFWSNLPPDLIGPAPVPPPFQSLKSR